VPFYQYGTNLTADAAIGATRIYFNNDECNVRAGQFLVIVNPVTNEIHISEVSAVEVDGASMNTSLGFDMTPFWLVAPALNCLINDGSGLDMNNVSGDLSITADSFAEPILIRPNAIRTVATFDNIPWLDRRPLINAEEKFTYTREVLDNETGARDINSRHLHPKVSGNRKFTIQRVGDPDEMDYWRSFFDTIRGGHKGFLMSTWLQDLTLSESYTLGSSSIIVNEGYYAANYAQYGTWDHIQFEFADGVTSQHTVTSAVANISGKCVISFLPALPADAAYAVPTAISFLQKWRATDRVVFNHYANYSEVSFGVTSSDD
jgi:hypothetical protein